jgi:hypothetical protein
MLGRCGGPTLGSPYVRFGDGLGCPSSNRTYCDRAAQSKQRPHRGDHGLKDKRHQPEEARISAIEIVHARLAFTMSALAPARSSARSSPVVDRDRGAGLDGRNECSAADPAPFES